MNTTRQDVQRAHTKIVATVGPASRAPERLEALIRAGVDVFRLNTAHGEIAEHEQVLNSIRELSGRLGRPVGVLVDLAGPKIRLGELPEGQVYCGLDEEFRFVRGKETSDPRRLTTTYDKLVDELDEGDRVMLADGTVSMAVRQKTRDEAVCRVVQAGLVRSRQGVNLPGVKVSLPAMSHHDRECAIWAANHEVDFVSLSFVRSPAEVHGLKALLASFDAPTRVIAKIEKQEALDRLEEIVTAADGVMVARGDLGVEIDVARMPVVQKQIVALCHRHHRPVIIATQMLDSMQRSPRPTRAEVTDVANAILDGCDACMLSGETAIGDFPVEAVQMMNRVAMATEPLLHNPEFEVAASEFCPTELQPVTHGVVTGAGMIAKRLGAKLVVVVSHGGATALALSKQRNPTPIIGVSPRAATLRQMSLYWGVVPLPEAPTTDSIALLDHIQRWGLEQGLLATGDRIVLVAGIGLASKGHNMVRVEEVGRVATG